MIGARLTVNLRNESGDVLLTIEAAVKINSVKQGFSRKRSLDAGKRGYRGAQVPGTQGLDEDQLVERSDGQILLDARQHSGPHRWTATSTDGGRTWSAPRPGQPRWGSPSLCLIQENLLY